MNNKEKYHTVRGYELLKRDKNILSHSMEDYLEMIYRNALKDGYIRMNALAQQLNVQVSSATKMVQRLSKLGFLNYKKYGSIYLTGKGKEVGNFLYHRHNTVLEFLKTLGIQEGILTSTELMEHGISANVVNHMDLLNRFINENIDIKKRFEDFKKNSLL